MQLQNNVRLFSYENSQMIKEGIIKSPEIIGESIRSVFNQIADLIRKAESLKICDKVIRKIDKFESDVIDKIPHVFDAFVIDAYPKEVLELLNSAIAPFKLLNDWLETNELKDIWDNKLCCFAEYLVKLPFRVVRNIISLVVNIIKAALYTTVHPLKAAAKLAKLIVKLVDELTKTTTWSKIGVGLIAASLANLAIGNPLSIVSLIVGASMTVGAISLGALVAALREKTSQDALSAAAREVWHHVHQLPEAMITSFCLGLIAGGVQRLALGNPVDKAVNSYIKDRGLLNPDKIEIDIFKNEVALGWKYNFLNMNQNYLLNRYTPFYYGSWANYRVVIPYAVDSVLPALLTSGISSAVSRPLAEVQ